MNFATLVIAVLLPFACIGVAAALMRLFDVKDATAEQAQAQAERLLLRVNHDLQTRRRVRAVSAATWRERSSDRIDGLT
jgi:hypothetical protein